MKLETQHSASPLTGWARTHWQTLFNIYLFCAFSWWSGLQTWKIWQAGRLDYVEVSFAVQNVILVAFILLRKPHRAIDTNPWHQVIAIIAFCSGAAFMGQPATGGPIPATLSKVIVFIANVAGCVTLLNLGRSFGILIALREVRTRGLYSLVRHPMYGTDILLRIGFLVSHINPTTLLVFMLSTACYIYRAVLEERFLANEPAYREYMNAVRFRFLPGVF